MELKFRRMREATRHGREERENVRSSRAAQLSLLITSELSSATLPSDRGSSRACMRSPPPPPIRAASFDDPRSFAGNKTSSQETIPPRRHTSFRVKRIIRRAIDGLLSAIFFFHPYRWPPFCFLPSRKYWAGIFCPILIHRRIIPRVKRFIAYPARKDYRTRSFFGICRAHFPGALFDRLTPWKRLSLSLWQCRNTLALNRINQRVISLILKIFFPLHLTDLNLTLDLGRARKFLDPALIVT